MAERRVRRATATATAASASEQVFTKLVKSRNVLSESEKEIEFEAEIFLTDPAFVRVSHGVTKSIGDYESLRVDVAVTVPCYRELIDQTVRDAGERVALLLENELDEYGVTLHGK